MMDASLYAHAQAGALRPVEKGDLVTVDREKHFTGFVKEVADDRVIVVGWADTFIAFHEEISILRRAS
jgi:hypothetical protein